MGTVGRQQQLQPCVAEMAVEHVAHAQGAVRVEQRRVTTAEVAEQAELVRLAGAAKELVDRRRLVRELGLELRQIPA